MRREHLSRRIGAAAVAMALSLALCSNALAVSADETSVDTGAVVETMAETGEAEAAPEADPAPDAAGDPAEPEGPAEPGEPEGDSTEADASRDEQDDSDASADDADGTSDDDDAEASEQEHTAGSASTEDQASDEQDAGETGTDAETVGKTGDPTKADEAVVQTAPVMQNRTRRAMARAPRAAEVFTITYTDGITADWDGLTDLTVDKSCTITLNKDLDQAASTAKLTIAADEEIAVTIEGNDHTLTTSTSYDGAVGRIDIAGCANVTIQNLTMTSTGNMYPKNLGVFYEMFLIRARENSKVKIQNAAVNVELDKVNTSGRYYGDMNTTSAPIIATDNAELTIESSNVDIDKGRAIIPMVSATVTVGDGSYIKANFKDVINVQGNSTLNIAGGKVECVGGYHLESGDHNNFYAIYNAGATVNVSSGEVLSNYACTPVNNEKRSVAIGSYNGTVTISGGKVSAYASAVRMMASATLNVKDGEVSTESETSDNIKTIEFDSADCKNATANISGGKIKSTGTAIAISKATNTLNISGGEIVGTDNTTTANLVSVTSGAVCNMTGGSITAGTNQKAVNLYGATFKMDDGRITASTANTILVRNYSSNNATFELNGGTISGSANEPIWVYTGTFNMNGGTVTGTGRQVVSVSNGAVMNMTDGTLTGTGSNYGINGSSSAITLTGGTIKDTSWGVLCNQSGITIGDKIKFENCKYADLWLYSNNVFTIRDDLLNDVKVQAQIARNLRQLTTSPTDKKMMEKVSLYNSGYMVGYDADEQYLFMYLHTHHWHYDVKDNTITVSCDSADTGSTYCPYTLTNQATEGALTWTLEASDAAYQEGTAYSGASVTGPTRDLNETPWGNGSLTYVGRGATSYAESTSAPSAAGTYTVRYTITAKDGTTYTVSRDFAITVPGGDDHKPTDTDQPADNQGDAYDSADTDQPSDNQGGSNETQGSGDPQSGWGSIQLYVTDQTTGSPLAGAVYALYRSNGTYIGTYTTDANGLIRIPSIEASTYYLVQYAAPEGYALDERLQRFRLLGDQDLVLSLQNGTNATIDPAGTASDLPETVTPEGAPDETVDDTVADNTADAADGTDDATNANDPTAGGLSANPDGNGGYIGSGAGDGHIAATGDDSLLVLYAAMAVLSAMTLAAWTGKARCHR